MEFFIVAVALFSALGGGLVLLACLSNRRAQLMKALHIQLQIESRAQQNQEST